MTSDPYVHVNTTRRKYFVGSCFTGMTRQNFFLNDSRRPWCSGPACADTHQNRRRNYCCYQQRVGLDTYCMFLSRRSSSFAQLLVKSWRSAGQEQVLSRNALGPRGIVVASSFEHSDAFEVIQTSLGNLTKYRCGELQGAFGKPGWLTVVTDWVRAEATAVDLSLTGNFVSSMRVLRSV